MRLELQADCFAGVWGHQAAQPGRAAQGKVELERGDIEEGLNAAAAIGDDRIQRMSGARVAPDRFTHGSSEQRVDLVQARLRERRLQGVRNVPVTANGTVQSHGFTEDGQRLATDYTDNTEGLIFQRDGSSVFSRADPWLLC